jgi:hypothetical protein
MNPTARRTTMTTKRLLAVLAALTLVGAGACSSDGDDNAGASAGAATTVTTSTSAAGPSYSTRFFAIPFDVELPSYLDPTPADDAENFVTWGSADGSVAARFLRPVAVYPPGSSESGQVPSDYVTYLLGQADDGARLEDREDTTVDGHEAVIVTGTTAAPLDGSLGCPRADVTADDCFGLQPDYSLRIAVVSTDSGLLLVWLRSAIDDTAAVAAQHERLDQLLAGVQFADRAVEAASSTEVDTEYDGVYRWTITKDDALAHGTPGDKSPAGLARFPQTFTATLEAGHFHMIESGSSDVEDGPFEASSGRLLLGDRANGLTTTVTRDPDGTLHLTPVPPILDVGAVFVLTTKPWVPVP